MAERKRKPAPIVEATLSSSLEQLLMLLDQLAGDLPVPQRHAYKHNMDRLRSEPESDYRAHSAVFADVLGMLDGHGLSVPAEAREHLAGLHRRRLDDDSVAATMQERWVKAMLSAGSGHIALSRDPKRPYVWRLTLPQLKGLWEGFLKSEGWKLSRLCKLFVDIDGAPIKYRSVVNQQPAELPPAAIDALVDADFAHTATCAE